MSETPGTDKPSPQRIEEPLGRQRLQFDPTRSRAISSDCPR